jgi:hypothetical protein
LRQKQKIVFSWVARPNSNWRNAWAWPIMRVYIINQAGKWGNPSQYSVILRSRSLFQGFSPLISPGSCVRNLEALLWLVVCRKGMLCSSEQMLVGRNLDTKSSCEGD